MRASLNVRYGYRLALLARPALQEAMLKSDEEPPIAAPKGRFARIELLRGVRAYPPRHTSTLLAFKAAVQAFEAALERV